jgi:hypothetical protein
MGGEDHNEHSLEELARRMEALERENRELREALGSGAPERELERPQQQPQAREMTVASSKTVRGLLLGPRDEQAYSRPLVGVLPSYVVGWLLTCAVGAYGAYIAFLVTVGLTNSVGINWLGVAPIAALFFGLYGGIRDGGRFGFAHFQYIGLITAVGTTVVVFLVSFGIAHWFWSPEEYRDIEFVLEELITDELNPFVIGAVFASTWLLFVSGALLGTALQLWASEKERVREGSLQGSGEERTASTASVRAQVWLGFAGTVLAALIALVGNLIGGQ